MLNIDYFLSIVNNKNFLTSFYKEGSISNRARVIACCLPLGESGRNNRLILNTVETLYKREFLTGRHQKIIFPLRS